MPPRTISLVRLSDPVPLLWETSVRKWTPRLLPSSEMALLRNQTFLDPGSEEVLGFAHDSTARTPLVFKVTGPLNVRSVEA